MRIRAALTARANILCGRALMSSQQRNRKAAVNRRRRRAALTVENAALKALSTPTTATGRRSAAEPNWRQIAVTAYFQRVSRGLKAAYFLTLTGTRSLAREGTLRYFHGCLRIHLPIRASSSPAAGWRGRATGAHSGNLGRPRQRYGLSPGHRRELAYRLHEQGSAPDHARARNGSGRDDRTPLLG